MSPPSSARSVSVPDTLPSTTTKVEIAPHRDLYIKVGYWDGRPVHIDITMSRIQGMMLDENLMTIVEMAQPLLEDDELDELGYCSDQVLIEMANLRTSLVETVRAFLEVACREASTLLSSGVWGWEELIHAWLGTSFDPWGVSKQLAMLGYENPTAKSPLDAAARLFLKRHEIWDRQMQDRCKMMGGFSKNSTTKQSDEASK